MNILPSFAWGKTLFRHLRINNGAVPLENKSSLHLSETHLGGTVGDEGMGDDYLSQNAYGCSSAEGNAMPTIEAFTFVLTVRADFFALRCLWQQSFHALAIAAFINTPYMNPISSIQKLLDLEE